MNFKSLLISGLLLSSVTFINAQNGQVQTATTPTVATTYTPENEGWLTNLDEAYEKSKVSGLPILANFTGSDWCGWCKRLTASVFVHDQFKQWAEKKVILLELDFPRGKAIPDLIKNQNANLQQAFQVQGFPTIWVFKMDKDASTNQYTIEALGKTGYTATVDEFTTGIEQMINR